MKNNDFDFDTSELLSNLDKLKAKYSFNLDDDDDNVASESKEEPFVSAPATQAEAKEPVTADKKSNATSDDMSWVIDGSSTVTEEEPEDELIEEPFAEEKPEQKPEPVTEQAVEVEPVAEPTVEAETPWYLDTDIPEEAETAETIAEPEVTEEPADDITSEGIDGVDDADDSEDSEEDTYSAEDDEEDEFADLDDDDDLVVIRHDENESDKTKSKGKKNKKAKAKEVESETEPDTVEIAAVKAEDIETTKVVPEATEEIPPAKSLYDDESSPFYQAFKEDLSKEKEKPAETPKAVKTQKPKKEPKEVKEKQPKNKKALKKSVLNIIVGVALAVALWGCLFVTDILLVSNWSAPIFCAVSETYEDGSKTYTGAFYQIQVSVNEDGSVSRVSLPWFAKGPNGEK